ncbi:hypothetical protein PYW07_012097 [Mythimna separata]|uniref:HMG box domain-containing protein n=1 Tax=Mythimna separata TaxID=271217 RepID=A0AAD7YM48_MYTSE|nr:hypothetical protein PYW07_012097 [Mythimna separata]
MPKKAPKNAFYYFMLDFKDEQSKKGINYASLAEVSKAADPEWRNAPPQVRGRYEARAKNEKERRNIPIAKYTSTGIPLSVIEQEQKALQEAIEYEIQDIINMVKTKKINKTIYEDDVYLIDVNYYCKTSTNYVIAESTVLRFNLTNGFRDFYHEMINPGFIPVGYASDVKLGCTDLGLDMPDDSTPKSNYMQILANIIDYLKQKDPSVKTLPPLYTMPDKVQPVQDFILQMCQKSGEDEFLFRVYRLDTLFFHLINNIKNRSNEGLPKESLALVQLKKDPFKYNPGLGCEHHEANEKSVECTTSRTKRWAFTILDSCCPVVGIPIIPGQHVPIEYDVEGIVKYKDSKKTWSGPTIAGAAGPSSSCNTTGNESFLEQSLNSTAASLAEHSRKEKRTHAPLRMPQTDYSKNIRPAPELTDEEFPALSIGAGRGRGLAGSFGKMKIKKNPQ